LKAAIADIADDANNSMLSLKSDRSTLKHRTEFQMRQREISLSNLVEELRHVRDAIDLLPEQRAGQINSQLDFIQGELRDSVRVCQVYGKLKYEGRVSQQLQSIRIYGDGLVREREDILRKMRNLGETLQDSDIKDLFDSDNKAGNETTATSFLSPGTPNYCINWKVEGHLFNTSVDTTSSPFSVSSSPLTPNKRNAPIHQSSISSNAGAFFENQISYKSEDFRINSTPESSIISRRRKKRESTLLSTGKIEQIRLSYWFISQLLAVKDCIQHGVIAGWIQDLLDIIFTIEIDKDQAVKRIRFLTAVALFVVAVVLILQSAVMFYHERYE